MTITERVALYNAHGFKYIMRIFWSDICVDISGYVSEAEFYSEYIRNLDALPSNGKIEVTKNW